MQVIDIVKPEPKTALEAYEAWKNHFKSCLISTSPFSKQIYVADGSVDWAEIHRDSQANMEHARQEDEAIQDA